MANSVDRRVVDLQLNNQQFERNAKQSQRTLDSLKKSLDMDQTTRGLDNLNRSAKKFSMASIAEDVAKVSDRFTTMGIIGMRALQNITDSAMRTGKQLVNAFTIDPVKSGFQEYETQINATQTILANTKKEGASIEKVNAALNELNEYADKTIYNFTEMTRNIGTFTAAGVDLKTSTAAIKGIANLAAVSGSTSQQASTAMYQLSQALAAGTVKLMDWNSVVNAGMGGQVFQDALIETARVHGVAIDEMIKKEGSFRETLSKGWLTSAVLTETLAKFTGDLTEAELLAIGYTKEQAAAIIDMGNTANEAATKVKTFTQLMDTLKEAAQSGWTQSWQIIIGDFEEAKALLTDISDYLNAVIGAQAEERNNMLRSWKEWGGREDLIYGLRYALEGLLSLLKPIHDAFKEIFPPITGFQLAQLTRKFMTFAAGMKLTSERADEFRRIFKGVFSIIKAFAVLTLQLVIGTLDILINAFDIVDGGLYAFAASLGDGATELANWVSTANVAATVLGYVAKAVAWVADNVDALAKRDETKIFLGHIQDFGAKAAEQFKNLLGRIKTFALEGYGKLQEFFTRTKILDSFTLPNIREALTKVFELVKGLFTFTKPELEYVTASIGTLETTTVRTFDNTGAKIDWLVEKFRWLRDKVSEFLGDNFGIGQIMTIVMGVGIIQATKAVSKAFESLIDTLNKVVGIFGSLVGIVRSIGDAFVGILNEVKNTLVTYQKKIKSEALWNIAKSIALLAASVALLALLPTDKLLIATGALVVLGAGLVGLSVAFTKFVKTEQLKDIDKLGKMLAKFGLAVAILVGALKLLEFVDFEGMPQRLVVLGLLMAGMTAVSVVMARYAPQLSKGSIFVIAFAVALNTMANTLKKLEKLNIRNIGQTLGNLSLAIAGLAAVLVAARGVRVGGAATILSTVVAILLLVGAFKALAAIDVNGIKKGLAAVIGIMALMAVLARLANGGTINSNVSAGSINNSRIRVTNKTSNPGVALLAMAAAVNLMVIALKGMAKINDDDIRKATGSLIAIGALFVAFTAVTHFAGKNAAQAGVALLAMAISMNLLMIPIVLLSILKPDGVKRATAVIVLIGLMMATVVGMTYFAKGAEKTIAQLTTSIIALTVMVAALSLIEPEKVYPAVGAVGILILLFDTMLYATKFAKKSKKAIPVILSLLAVVLAIGTMLGVMAYLDVQPSIQTAVAIGMLMNSMTMALRLIPNTTEIQKGTLVNIAAMMAVLLAIGTMLGVMSYLGVEASIPTAIAIATLMVAFGIAMKLVPNEKELQVGSLAGIAAMTLCAIAIGALLGYLNYAGIEASITTAIAIGILVAALAGALRLLPQVSSLTAFQGSLLALLEITVGLGVLIAALGALMQIDGFEQIMRDGGDAMVLLGSAIGGFVGAVVGGVVGGIAAGATAFLPLVGESLTAFGEAIQPFLKMTEGVTDTQMLGVKYLCEAILMMTGAELVQGLTNFIFGFKDPDRFETSIAALGRGVKAFAEETEGLDSSSVTAAANAGKVIAEFARAIPNEGGVIGWWAGENDLGAFGDKLAKFAPSFASFCKYIQDADIDNETIEKCMSTAKAVAAFASEVPNEGGAIAWWVGENDLGLFAMKLAAFAPSFVSFCKSIQDADIDHKLVEKSINMAKAIAGMASDIPNTGGVLDGIFGSNNIDEFGVRLAAFGGQFAIYAKRVGSIPEDVVARTGYVVDSIVALTEVIPTNGGLFGLIFGGAEDVNRFGQRLADFGACFNSYYESVRTIGTYSLSGIEEHLRSLISLAKDITEVNSAAMYTFATNLESLANVGISKFKGPFGDAKVDLKNLGEEMMLQVLSGAKDKLGDFQTMGEQAIRGFTNGIRGKLKDVRDISTAIGTTAEKATKDSLGIHSPSLIFKAIAGFVAGGFITGMDKSLPDIRETMQSMVDNITGVTTDGLISNNAMAAVGSGAMNSLAKGISNSQTPEEAAKAKADAIVQIFQAGLDQIDLNFNTKNLEYQLWEALNPGADEATKAMMNMAMLSEKIEDTKSKVELYRDQYLTFLEEFGEADSKTQEQYNNYLQAQIDLANLSSELANANAEENKRQMEAAQTAEQARKAYYDYMRENNYLIEKYGITYEQLMADAARQTGYDPSLQMQEDTKSVERNIQESMERLQVAFGLVDDSIAGHILGTYSNWGEVTSEAMANSIQQQIDLLNTNGDTIPISIVKSIDNNMGEIENGAEKIPAAINAITEADLDTEPVIRPVVDTSEVEKSYAYLNQLAAPLSSASSSSASQTASSFNSSLKNTGIRLTDTSKGDVASSASALDYTYIQNIYSPTAVNRTAVYRDTKSLLSQAKN